MHEWPRLIQGMVDEIDRSILAHEEETLTLQRLSRDMGYSAYHATRKFREIAGIPLRDYLRRRRLAFALKEVRDSDRTLLDIAVDYGFSSHEAFTRAFKTLYGVTPGVYRRDPRPLVLRTKIHPFDRYAFGMGEIGMIKSEQGVKTYFVTIPAHRYLRLRNYESNGYWDFWEKQSCECGELAAMIHSVCRKRAWALRHGKKVSQMDERYLKRAEDQLYGELAAVLGTERGEVADLIRRSWPGWPEKLPEPAAVEA